MPKFFIALAIATALMSTGAVCAQNAAPNAARIMAPPPPARKDDTAVTVLGKKTPMPDIPSDAYGDEPRSLNTPMNDAATGTSEMTLWGRPIPRRLFALGRAYIAAHDHSLDDAFAAYNASDFPKALTLFKRSYEKMGYSTAAVMVARMYLFGLGTPRDTQQAIVWLKRDANDARPPVTEIGYRATYFPRGTEAAMALGRIYALGYDVPVDAREARHWYKRADQLGYYPATHVMGDIYRTGYAGEKDIGTAIRYYKRAGLAGYGPSSYALAQIYYLGEDGVPADPKLGLSWLEASARAGDPDGLYAAGRFCETGEGGVTVDPAKALVYYKEAAVKGQPDAAEAIGRAFYAGNGLPKDPVFARKWFQKGAEGANVDAMFNLAVMLMNGEGGDRDLVKAWVWLKIADAGGHEQARTALAQLEPKMTADELAGASALFAPKDK